MNKEQIIKIMKDATNNSKYTYLPDQYDDLVIFTFNELEQFVKLVIEHDKIESAKIADFEFRRRYPSAYKLITD